MNVVEKVFWLALRFVLLSADSDCLFVCICLYGRVCTRAL